MINGILNINKPEGLTSSDVVVKVKRIFGQKKVGHMGTLDPMATGVLIIGLGKSARLFVYFLNKDKEYNAVFKFGFETDTLDSTGTIINTSDIIPAETEVLAALPSQTGLIDQMPPRYSAKSIGGVRAYTLARRGEDFKLNSRRVEIKKLELTKRIDESSYAFRIVCSSGTYIRSIARDLSAALGTFATMTALERTRSATFNIDNAFTLDEVGQRKELCLAKTEDAVHYPSLEINQLEHKKLLDGIRINCFTPDGNYKVFCGELFLGLGEVRDSTLKINVWIAL